MKYYANINSNDELTGVSRGVITADEFGSNNVKNIPVSNEIGENAEKYGANYYIYQDGEILENPNYESEQQAKERTRINMLSMTAADVERAIYKAKGMVFDDILELVKANPSVDVKALKIELKANNFYRGNPYIDTIGGLLGLTTKQLDEFFETGDYEKLVSAKIEVAEND